MPSLAATKMACWTRLPSSNWPSTWAGDISGTFTAAPHLFYIYKYPRLPTRSAPKQCAPAHAIAARAPLAGGTARACTRVVASLHMMACLGHDVFSHIAHLQ